MRFDPDRHHRRSIRLKGYDYAQAGAYFVTVCTRNRLCLFGDVADGKMRVNEAGRMVERWWLEVNRKFPNAKTDVYTVMPNHFHGIIAIVGTDAETVGAALRVCPGNPPRQHGAPHDGGARHRGAHTGAPLPNDGGTPHGTERPNDTPVGAALRVYPGNPENQHGAPHDGGARHRGAHAGAPLPTVVQWFKSMTTNEYIRGVKTLGWSPFAGTLWQRNYYERIVRDEAPLVRIQQYILDNPARWAFDRENADAAVPEPAPMPKTP